eukprot:Nitzschia sp. Nitz4//scaffold3_size479765//311229//312956//NITZ4_000128-RA/size479765-processed-gene-1.470-mRNA-1//1//CDS//3329550842//8801//frame0
MKSVVAYDEDGKPLVGAKAIAWEKETRMSGYRHVKRVIGNGSTFLSKDTRRVVPHLAPPTIKIPPKVKKMKVDPPPLLLEGDAKVNPSKLFALRPNVDGSRDMISPETVSSEILKTLIEAARIHIGKTITRAVVGVPAHFHDAQREATIRAANMAGIEKVQLLREPEAAALAYGLGHGQKKEELVLVFDLGGGTYDVSILLIEDRFTQIVCSAGDPKLGGSDFDATMTRLITRLSNSHCDSEVSNNKLVQVAEAVRIYLSNRRSAKLAIPISEEGWSGLVNPASVILDANEPFVNNANNQTHRFIEIPRDQAEKEWEGDLQRLLPPLREAAIMAGAMLPGDSSPVLVEEAREAMATSAEAIFEDFYEDDKSERASNTDRTLLDWQAAKRAQRRGRRKSRIVGRNQKEFRKESKKALAKVTGKGKIMKQGISGRPIDRVVLVGGATRMPCIGRLVSRLLGIQPQKTIDPDEAIALGCAVQVGVLDGNDSVGTVLNPMQAALLRFLAKEREREAKQALSAEPLRDHDPELESDDFEASLDREFSRGDPSSFQDYVDKFSDESEDDESDTLGKPKRGL